MDSFCLFCSHFAADEVRMFSMSEVDRFRVGGESNEWLNITQTNIFAGAELPDSGIYMCKICTGECYTANVTIHMIGAVPVIDNDVNNSETLNIMYIIINR